MEREQVVAGDGVDRSLGGEPVDPVAITVDQAVPLACLDRLGLVVAPLHVREHVLLGLGQAGLVEARLAQHVHHQGQAAVEVLGKQVEADAARNAAHRGRKRGGQEVEFLVEGLGVERPRPAGPPHGAHQLGQAFFAGRFEIPAAAEEHLHRHEGEHAVGGDVDRNAVGELDPHRGGVRHLESQRRVLELLGPRGNRRLDFRRRSHGGGGQDDGDYREQMRASHGGLLLSP